TGNDLVWLTEHHDPARKAWAYRLIAADPARAAQYAPGLAPRLEDLRDCYCLLDAAAGLQRFTPKQRAEAADVLVRNPGFAADQNLSLMLWYGIAPWLLEDSKEAIRAIR